MELEAEWAFEGNPNDDRIPGSGSFEGKTDEGIHFPDIPGRQRGIGIEVGVDGTIPVI